MQTRVRKWGNSLAIRIPRSMAADLGIAFEDRVDMRVNGGRLEVLPLGPSGSDLESLLELVTPENIHTEDDFGQPVGREIW